MVSPPVAARVLTGLCGFSRRSEGRGHKLIGVVKRVASLAMWLSAVRGPVGASLSLATVGGVFASLVVPLPVAVLSCGIHLGRSIQAL
jgi:hypothetical protein